MKNKNIRVIFSIILFLFLFLCNGVYSQNEELETPVDAPEHYETDEAAPTSMAKALIRFFVLFIQKSDTHTLVILGIIAVIVYILAIILSNKTTCIILWGWWDLLLVVIPGGILVYYLFNMNNDIKYDIQLNIIFFVLAIITIVLSIIINCIYSGPKGIFFGIISILSKLIIMIGAPLILFLYVMALSSGKPDRRYKDGTKGNTKTIWLAIVSLIAIYLVVNLIKTEGVTRIKKRQ